MKDIFVIWSNIIRLKNNVNIFKEMREDIKNMKQD